MLYAIDNDKTNGVTLDKARMGWNIAKYVEEFKRRVDQLLWHRDSRFREDKTFSWWSLNFIQRLESAAQLNRYHQKKNQREYS